MMRIAIVHNAVSDAGGPDERDVLVQAAALTRAVRSLGHQAVTVPCDLNLGAVARHLQESRVDVVFNLVESLNGHDRLIHLFPEMLDAMGIAYTGSPSQVIRATSHKVLAKSVMQAAGIPTPAWRGPYPQDATAFPALATNAPGGEPEGQSVGSWIVKSLWNHASAGLDERSVLSKTSCVDILEELPGHAARLGGACFAEEYIHGREFNLSLLAAPGGPRVLSPAEIRFEGYDTSRPRIVDYRAKWVADSYEYRHTPRTFEFVEEDSAVLAVIEELALRCWRVFGVRGYARVDFRVDRNGSPWVLEINANPCLSHDAGFAAALATSGLDFTQAVEAIIQDGMSRHAHRADPQPTAESTGTPEGRYR